MSYAEVLFDGCAFRRYEGRTYYVGLYKGVKTSLHRAVWESQNGPVPAGWHVHHIDHNPENNDIQNLIALSQADHLEVHRQEKPQIERKCDFCGSRYTVHIKRDSYRPPKWCSNSCRDKDRRQRGVYSEQRTCVTCGSVFIVPVKSDPGRTCSRECAERLRYRGNRDCLNCGESFLARREWAKFCSSRCKQRYANAQKRQSA